MVAGPLTIGAGLVSAVAASADGSRFAALFAGNGGVQLLLIDGSLKQVATYVPENVQGVTFSRDGMHLYLSESSSSAAFVTVLDGSGGKLIGRVPDASIQGVASQIEDADETQLLFGVSNRGISFVDASVPTNLSTTAPSLAAAPSVQPSEGPIGGGTSVAVAGQNFTSTTQLNFGTQSALNVTLSRPAQIQANAPASVTNGAVNATAYFQDGWLAIAPDAFSYGPQIVQLLPNAGTSAGGDSVQIYGYGFGSDPTKIIAKIGGANATVQNVQTLPALFRRSVWMPAILFHSSVLLCKRRPVPPAKRTSSFQPPRAQPHLPNHFSTCKARNPIRTLGLSAFCCMTRAGRSCSPPIGLPAICRRWRTGCASGSSPASWPTSGLPRWPRA